jgi:GT2 family glycosyltransferase
LNLNFEIILVDNASTECDPDLFLENFPKIILIKSSVNLGFAGGNNIGLKHSKGDYILLLNSDTILLNDCISPCLNHLEKNRKIGVISPKLLNPDLSFQKNARKFKSIKLELLDFFRPIIKQTPYRFYSRVLLNQYFKGDFDTKCDWLCGAFLMVRKSDLDKLGGKLDDRYFMYGEDQLWCWQYTSLLGLESYFLSNWSLVHIGGSSSKEANKFQSIFLINREIELYSLRNSHSIFKSIKIFYLLLLLKKEIVARLLIK